jgi:hypothetical protein
LPGPFDVDPASVQRLGAAFPFFVNDLLVAEVGHAGLAGFQLDINRQVNTADGGVDAVLWNSIETAWLPAGHSAWQFKSSDLEPADCKRELRGARWARELLIAGATYVLVLGRPLVGDMKQDRLDALVEEGLVLGLTAASFRVYDGNQLARWASTYPARALDRRLGGPGPSLLDFDRWSGSSEHQERWVRCESRSDMEDAVRRVARGELQAYRLEGGPGLGKTRLAMEVLRGSPARSLAVYAPRGEQLTTETLSYLGGGDRSCVLVVDNCARAHHQSVLEQVDTRSIRVLTIGIDSEDRLVRTPLHQLPPARPEEIEAILRENVPGLWQEAARVVHENSFGNVRTALLMAARLVDSGEQNVTELLRQNDFRQLITTLLPEHIDFFSAAVLALLERVGLDRDRSYQLEILSDFANIPLDRLKSTAGDLEVAGLLMRQGRYRSITPQPLAVYLAASAWERLMNRIWDELVPRCDAEMLEALFHRGAELGRFEPVRSVLFRLLSKNGPYGTLARIEEAGNAEFLVQLSIVLPEETLDHLAELIEAATVEELHRQTRSRRGLVRAFEKLVWHKESFERAANGLLKLALAENESWANNATGQWFALFGARLPTTAATPEQRLAYLRQQVSSMEPDVRDLVVRAVSAALHPHESAMVSGELQEGTIVAPRGTVRPGSEALRYWTALVEILDVLRRDERPEIASAAHDGLIAAIDPFIDIPQVGEALGDVVATFTGNHLRQVRRSLQSILDFAEEESTLKASALRLLERLPTPSPIERLRDLAEANPWDWREDDRKSELHRLIEVAQTDGTLPTVVGWLGAEQLASSWQIGHAIGLLPEHDSYLADFAKAAPTNPSAMAGFLAARNEDGDETVFDRFIDEERGRSLPASVQLFLTVSGPRSRAASARVLSLSHRLPVVESASRTLLWQERLADAETLALLEDWDRRLKSDRDYAAVIDWIQMLASRRQGLPSELNEPTRALLRRRSAFPNIGHQRWDWCQLAATLAVEFPEDIAKDILDLVSEGNLTLLDSNHEAAVLSAAAKASPQSVWALAAGRIVNGDWRVSMGLRGWFTKAIPLDVIEEWISDSVDRARVVASVAPAGRDEPDPLAVLLLSRFPDDNDIAGALVGEFQSGVWYGPWSDRLDTQIAQLRNWRRNLGLPLAVRTWAGQMIAGLERQRSDALEREAEDPS